MLSSLKDRKQKWKGAPTHFCGVVTGAGSRTNRMPRGCISITGKKIAHPSDHCNFHIARGVYDRSNLNPLSGQCDDAFTDLFSLYLSSSFCSNILRCSMRPRDISRSLCKLHSERRVWDHSLSLHPIFYCFYFILPRHHDVYPRALGERALISVIGISEFSLRS